MSVAIRTAVRIQDQDDAPTLGAGQDGYALTWDNASGAFVATALSAGVTDHGALTGLADDDHTQYALLAGRAGGQTLYGGTAANDDITIHGTSNVTRTTSYVILQPTAGNVGIGTTAPTVDFHVVNNTRTGGAMIGAHRTTGGATWAFLAAGDVGNGIPPSLVFLRGTTLNIVSDATFGNGATTSAGIRVSFNATADSHFLGIGKTPSAALDVSVPIGGATNSFQNLVLVRRNLGYGTAAGFGAGQQFLLESSTTASSSAAAIKALWYDATHATRKADLVLTAYDTSEREGLRIRGAGSAAAIGFLGATPIARIAHVADPAGGATVDAEARSAINSILATLEGFGFHATS